MQSNIIQHPGTIQDTGEKPRGGAPKANKNAETHGHYRRKTKLQPVSFDDLNFSSSGGEQLKLRRDELIQHCGGSVNVVKRRIIERICFLEYQIDHADLYLVGLVTRRDRLQ